MADEDVLQFQILVNKDGAITVREFNQEVATAGETVKQTTGKMTEQTGVLDKLKKSFKEHASLIT